MMLIGRTVLALEEPVAEALAKIETAPDEPLPPDEPLDPPERSSARAAETPSGADAHDLAGEATALAPIASASPQGGAPSSQKPRGRFSITDIVVMATAIGVLALSIAGLVWLLRG
jgi:hypothetical protein